MTDLEQPRRLRDSWGFIGVAALATLYLVSSAYQAAQQDWSTTGTHGALGVFFLGVLAWSSTRRR